MKTTARVTNPEIVEVEITITMPLADWVTLNYHFAKVDIQHNWPAGELYQAIETVIQRIRRTVDADAEKE